jgi:hypothetical protein
MKVFLSWSGKTSREVATAFRDWLPYVIQAVKPFISVGDIGKGRRWSEVLASELNESAYGIIFLTQRNHREPWINFEAGAISKAIDGSYVSPFLFNLDASRVPGPLKQFQSTLNDREDILNLLKSINSRLKDEEQLTDELLRREFDAWWPELKSKLDKIAAMVETDTETGFDWLYTVDDLARIQVDTGCKCVWFVTPRLFRNALSPKIKDIIQRNMDREITYTFIIPSSDETDAKDRLMQMAKSKPGKLYVHDATPADDFRSLAVTDYLIMNADSGELQVFLELPIASQGYPSQGYWIKVEYEAAIGFVGRFKKLATEARAACLQSGPPVLATTPDRAANGRP